MRKVLAVLLSLVVLSGTLQLELDLEKVVVVSNSIDYSAGLIRYLEKTFDVISITAAEFPAYQGQHQYQYFIILGGPDAPQGIGELIRSILLQSEQESLRTPGEYNLFVHTLNKKTYIILAGSDREHTQLAAATLKGEIPQYIPKNPMEWLETMDIEEVTDMVITDLDHNLTDDYVFACRRVVSDPWDRGVIYVFEEYTLKWYYHLATIVKAVTAYDLDSDGTPEIIAACDILADQGDLYVFDTHGTMKWRQHLPGVPKSVYCYKNYVAVNVYGQGERVMIFDSEGEKVKDFPVNGDVSQFEIKDINNDEKYELIVAGNVNNNWEHFLVVYDMDERDHEKRVLWNYTTNEHINDFVFYDIDNDGIQETVLAAYNALYVTRGGDLLARIELPPPILHVGILEEQVLAVNQNTMFLISFSDILNLGGGTTYVRDFTLIADSAFRLTTEPQFLFLKDIDFDGKDEILVGNGEILEIHEVSEFAPPEIVITQPVAFLKEAEVAYAVYENFDYMFRINYPERWAIEEDAVALTVTFSSLISSAAFEVAVADLLEPTTLEEYTAATMESLQAEGHTIEEEGVSVISNTAAYRVVTTRKVAQYTVKSMIIWTIKGDRLYVVTYSAERSHYPLSLDIAQKMIESFEIFESIYFVSICGAQIDAPGDDNENRNGEWIRICNDGTTDIDMTGWTLENSVGIYYEFPAGFILKVGASVTVFTGAGDNTVTELYWDYAVEVWNNYGDVVVLIDGEGNTVVEYEWVPE